MKSQKLPAGSLIAHRRCNSGAALVIALSCIVILSGLVLAFLTFSLLQTQVSTASAGQTSAGLFARGAIDSVISELKQEITAGSIATYPPTTPSVSDVRDPNCFFLPITNQAMVPYRMDPGAPANVIKRSANGLPFYSGSFYNASWPAPTWAANFSSTNPGTLGRAVSLARWNKPLLMPTLNPASTDVTPVSTFIPPDWIYMTRTAGPVTAWSAALGSNTALNNNYVVGRYAYVVYDEGGLLDVNAAGYPTAVTLAMVRNKISEACADLTQIGLTANDINTLVNWRNPINAATSTLYTNYVYTPNTNAFLTPATGERLFTSRQQLIDFLMQNIANGDTTATERMQAALPFLTHFSRELNAPSWYPEINVAASGAYGYYNNATNSATLSTTTNIFVPLARANASYTNTANLTIQTNQPVAFSRFPLSRLAWLGTNGPANGATAAQVQQSFGLKWDSANTAWQYVGTGATVLSTVSSLGQITGREPNFFELLKAGIFAGSVNVVPQPVYLTFPNPGDVDSRCGTNNGAATPLVIPIQDQQTMQIGLAMIDQASTNALPTRVEFGANAGTNPNNGEDKALYGSKNLPFIDKIVMGYYRPTTTQPDLDGNTQAYLSAWAEPVFWSPYLSAVTNTAPLQVRIRVDGTNAASGFTQFYSDTYNGNSDMRPGTPALPCGGPGNSTASGGTSGATIELDAANAATLQAATVNPVLFASLLTSGAIANPPPINDIRAQNPVGWAGQPGAPTDADIYTEGTTTYAGFWMGLMIAPLQLTDSKHSTATPLGPFYNTRFALGQKNPQPAGRVSHQFVLEANYGTSASPKFLEVQRMNFQYIAQSPVQVQEADVYTVPNRHLDWFTFDDPRTSRFPFIFMNPTSYVYGGSPILNSVTAADISQLTYTLFPNSANPFTGYIYNTPGANSSSINILPTPGANGGVNLSPGAKNPAQDIFRFADNSASGSSSQNTAYQDGDGAQRLGDAWWSSASVNTMPMRIDAGTIQYRPVILNRPFYSVGELGYVYRDMPWRSLNFNSATSADAGLLDFFSVNDGYAGSTNAPVVAGVLNLNTSHPEVLQAMLNGAARAQLYPGTTPSASPPGFDVSATDATNMANAITNYTWVNSTVSTGPLLNKSEVATRLTAANVDTASTSPDNHIKERQETIVRALASAGQVRTWNLMIDVIAQTGHVPPTATDFTSFVVTAEQRYWAHVAIDRYTGQVISIQLEPVSE